MGWGPRDTQGWCRQRQRQHYQLLQAEPGRLQPYSTTPLEALFLPYQPAPSRLLRVVYATKQRRQAPPFETQSSRSPTPPLPPNTQLTSSSSPQGCPCPRCGTPRWQQNGGGWVGGEWEAVWLCESLQTQGRWEPADVLPPTHLMEPTEGGCPCPCPWLVKTPILTAATQPFPPGLVDAKDGAHRDAGVDVGGAVQGVKHHHVLPAERLLNSHLF